MTEVLDFLRLLWARLGLPTCPECAATIENWSVDRITQAVSETYADQPTMVLAPVIRERKGEYRKELADFRTRGFVRARIDGVVRQLDEDIELHLSKYHTIELVLDRLKVEPEKSSRIAEAIEQALALASGLVAIVLGAGDDYRVFSTLRACPDGHGSIPEMEPSLVLVQQREQDQDAHRLRAGAVAVAATGPRVGNGPCRQTPRRFHHRAAIQRRGILRRTCRPIPTSAAASLTGKPG